MALLIFLTLGVVFGPPELLLNDRIRVARAIAHRVDTDALRDLPDTTIVLLTDLPLNEPLTPEEQNMAERTGFVVAADGIREGSHAVFVPIGFDTYLGYDLTDRCWRLDRRRITLLPLCTES